MILPFVNSMQHYIRITRGISQPQPVLSGVPEGTVIGILLFYIMIIDIDKGLSSSYKLGSFANSILCREVEKATALYIFGKLFTTWLLSFLTLLQVHFLNVMAGHESNSPCQCRSHW